MQIDVRDNINQVLARLGNYRQDVVDKAIPRSLNRVGDMAKTQAGRTLRSSGYNFKAGEIAEAISLSRASASKLRVTMRVRRRVKALLNFNARETKAGVYVTVKGARKLIKGAFIGQLRNGDQAVFIEDKAAGKTILRHSKTSKHGSVGGWKAVPVRKLYGPSIGGSYANDQVQVVMLDFIGQRFSERLAHEIKQLSR